MIHGTLLLIALAGILVLAITNPAQADCAGPCAPPAETPVPRGFLSPSEIAVLASNAGWEGDDLQIAVAVALAESIGGNPNAYNPEKKARGGTPNGFGSYGLWQIYLKAHPEFRVVNLYDPQTNANVAFGIYRDADYSFEPWATYDPRDGSTPLYLAWMGKAQAGIDESGVNA